ncbi:hypothetical protein CRG98_014745 [Punica granatum]|uniref:Uncharacterized protein n=1 Tax=Punica granatum TaxID=22663 RepID=A0A2I0K9H5_PUNGR|nr:hypothetical protein CRG98_014745 [Punica granatum]
MLLLEEVSGLDTERRKSNGPETGGLEKVMADYYNWPWQWQFIRDNYYSINNDMGSAPKHYGGTGVFLPQHSTRSLPQHNRRPSMEAELGTMSSIGTGGCRSCRGTGVFINQKLHLPTHKRTKSCGVIMRSNCNNSKAKGGTISSNNREQKTAAGGKQLSAVKSDQTFHLPDDWIY